MTSDGDGSNINYVCFDEANNPYVDHVTNNSCVEHFFIRSHLDKYLSPSSASGRIGLDSFYCSRQQAFPARLLFTAASFPRQVTVHGGKLSPGKVTVHGGKLSPARLLFTAASFPRQCF